jgi:enoyl-CoA hydratase/carnithine racemase
MMRSLLLRSTAHRLAGHTTACRAVPSPARPLCFSTLKDSYDYVTVETKNEGTVGLITLNRPKAMNALCDDLFTDLIHAATALDKDDAIGCLVLTGSLKAFAAGADISEMKDRTFDYAYKKVRASV